MALQTDEEYLRDQEIFATEKHRPKVDDINLHKLKAKILEKFPEHVTCSIWGAGHCNVLLVECGNMVIAQILGYTFNHGMPQPSEILTGIVASIAELEK